LPASILFTAAAVLGLVILLPVRMLVQLLGVGVVQQEQLTAVPG
jgi:hypothetical protein